jgi:hypothetical protein
MLPGRHYRPLVVAVFLLSFTSCFLQFVCLVHDRLFLLVWKPTAPLFNVMSTWQHRLNFLSPMTHSLGALTDVLRKKNPRPAMCRNFSLFTSSRILPDNSSSPGTSILPQTHLTNIYKIPQPGTGTRLPSGTNVPPSP